MSSQFQEIRENIETELILVLKRFTIIAVNLFSWLWIIKLIFIQKLPLLEGDNWEKYAMWFFFSTAWYFFYLRNRETVLFKTE